MGDIALWVGIVLILIFHAYLWLASRVPDEASHEFVGMAAIILTAAEPFAEALVESGGTRGHRHPHRIEDHPVDAAGLRLRSRCSSRFTSASTKAADLPRDARQP
jgi:hypothetical protein